MKYVEMSVGKQETKAAALSAQLKNWTAAMQT